VSREGLRISIACAARAIACGYRSAAGQYYYTVNTLIPQENTGEQRTLRVAAAARDSETPRYTFYIILA